MSHSIVCRSTPGPLHNGSNDGGASILSDTLLLLALKNTNVFKSVMNTKNNTYDIVVVVVVLTYPARDRRDSYSDTVISCTTTEVLLIGDNTTR